MEIKYDNPLSDPKEDMLNRKDFAENLAKSIINLKAQHGFVYGLYGSWGSGKSTVINFVEHFIETHNKNGREGKKSKIVIFRFNPWTFSDSENLTKAYLIQLRTRLGMSDVSKELQKVSKYLKVLEQVISIVGTFIFPDLINKMLNKLKFFISSTDSTVNSLSNLTKKDLHHIKKEITTVLEKQDDKILVILDDLDRLFNQEIRDFIKMTKAVCDFPKIIYLIACDHEKVANALNKDSRDDLSGHNYLEKIVQCSFNVPRPDQGKLYELFLLDLSRIIEPLKNEKLLFDKKELQNIFYDGIAPHFKTPRNVKKLLNSVASYYSAICDEVNIADFLGVQTLRVFYPKAYAIIEQGNAKAYLTGFTDNQYEAQKKLIELFYEQLHKQVPKKELEIFKKLMSRLFPKYAEIFMKRGVYGNNYSEKWKKNRKVCSHEYFDLYFTLSIPDNSFSIAETQAIIQLADNMSELKEKLGSFVEQDKKTKKGSYRVFLKTLSEFTEDIEKHRIKPLLQVIYNMSDKIGLEDAPIECMGMINTNMYAENILHKLLIRFEQKEERFDLLKEIFKSSESISMVVQVLSLINKDNIFTPEQIQTLKNLALKLIRQFANDGKLAKVPKLELSLYCWKEYGSEAEAKKYVTTLIETDEGLIDLLTGFLTVGTSYSVVDAVETKKYRVRHQNLLNFISHSDLDKLLDRSRQIIKKQEQLTEQQKIALEIFVDEKDNPQNYVF